MLKRSMELTLTVTFALVLTGCTDGNSEYSEIGESCVTADSDLDHGHGSHGHGSHGPNGGDIVELGNEEFHAEVVVDESANRIDVFILGSDAETAKPIAASEITLSFTHGDEIEEFQLMASALDGEPDGQASKFTLTDEDAFEELHEHSEGATLTFTAGDQKLSGTFTHSHDHGHDHGSHEAHGEHAEHDHGDATHDEHADHNHGDETHGEHAEHDHGDDAHDEHTDHDHGDEVHGEHADHDHSDDAHGEHAEHDHGNDAHDHGEHSHDDHTHDEKK